VLGDQAKEFGQRMMQGAQGIGKRQRRERQNLDDDPRLHDNLK
jgi:hypothetical protein